MKPMRPASLLTLMILCLGAFQNCEISSFGERPLEPAPLVYPACTESRCGSALQTLPSDPPAVERSQAFGELAVEDIVALDYTESAGMRPVSGPEGYAIHVDFSADSQTAKLLAKISCVDEPMQSIENEDSGLYARLMKEMILAKPAQPPELGVVASERSQGLVVTLRDGSRHSYIFENTGATSRSATIVEANELLNDLVSTVDPASRCESVAPVRN